MAYTFRPLKTNHFTGLVAESLKVVLKTQQSVCDHRETIIYYFIYSGEVDAEDINLSNITDDENESEFGTSVFDTDEVVPIRSDETENCVY